MPRGVTPRQPSRSGRQDKISSVAKRAKERIVRARVIQHPLNQNRVEWGTRDNPSKANR